MPIVTQRFESTVYDGTNGLALATEWLTGVTLLSDDGETLELAGSGPDLFVVRRGDYIIRQTSQRVYWGSMPEDAYRRNFVELAEPEPDPEPTT